MNLGAALRPQWLLACTSNIMYLQKTLDIFANLITAWMLNMTVLAKCITVSRYGNVDIADYYISHSQLCRVDVLSVAFDFAPSQHVSQYRLSPRTRE